MLSAESFISNIDAKSLSMDETEFSSNMESARALLSGLSTDADGLSNQTDSAGDYASRGEQMETRNQSSSNRIPATPPKTSETKLKTRSVPYTSNQASMEKIPSLSDLENKGAAMLLKEDQVSKTFQEFPYLYAQAGDLTVNDVEDLLSNYKRIVFKYVCLSKGMGVATSQIPMKLQTGGPNQTETEKKSEDIQSESQEETDRTDDRVSLIEDESLGSKSPPNEPLEPQGNPVGETSQ